MRTRNVSGLAKSIGSLNRFCAYNALTAIGFLLFWSLIVIVEAKIHSYGFLKYIFFGSLPLVFVGFFLSTRRALRDRSESPADIAVISSAVISPAFIVLGVVAVTNFKFLIGGHL